MPRSPRIEYAGAVYHIMCRGDRRESIFADDNDRRMFLATLTDACERTGWRILAYALMPNHYHLVLATPRAGLIDGMRWLQTTYTVRYNVRHHVCGHLFQGRYKAIPLDPDDPGRLRILGDYVHLNPVRARLLPPSRAGLPRPEAYPWTSLPAILGRAPRPPWLDAARLPAASGLTPPAYAQYLRKKAAEIQGADEGAMKLLAAEWQEIRRGWALGGEDFRQDLLKRVGERMALRKRESYSGQGPCDCDVLRARSLLEKGLAALKLSLEDVRSRKTTDAEKQALVWLLRTATAVPPVWLCDTLGLGHRSNVSRAVRAMQAPADPVRSGLWAKMLQCKD